MIPLSFLPTSGPFCKDATHIDIINSCIHYSFYPHSCDGLSSHIRKFIKTTCMTLNLDVGPHPRECQYYESRDIYNRFSIVNIFLK